MQVDIYIHTHQSREEVAAALAHLLQAEVSRFYTIEGQDYTIYTKINKGGARYGEPRLLS